jgi:hypothetical protein
MKFAQLLRRFMLCTVSLCCLAPAWSQQAKPDPTAVSLRDPWVPPESRKPSTGAPTSGAALEKQVQDKLKQSFDAADTQKTGRISKAQAQAAGLGFIVKHFDEIDSAGTGTVHFADYQRFLQKRAQTIQK